MYWMPSAGCWEASPGAALLGMHRISPQCTVKLAFLLETMGLQEMLGGVGA